MKTIREVIQDNRAWYCLDCGKCSSICPITLHLADKYTSPRLLVETTLNSEEDWALDEPLLFSCLTCGRCSELCPAEVDFLGFVRETRQIAVQAGQSGSPTHSGMIQSWMHMMADPDLGGDRLGWIDPELEVDPASDTIYFPGCLPYFDAAFQELGIEGLEIARSAVRVLNAIGIAPQILPDERCCGHDLYWQGDQEGFRALATLNLEAIARSGAKQIVTTCPECAYTLQHTYREEVGDPGLAVYHLTEFLIQEGWAPGKNGGSAGEVGALTYQDPCRLGRLRGTYQAPRQLLAAMGAHVIEMEHNRSESICCGSSCWTSCGATNKNIQADRLQEAHSTGADVLVTACPKCQIHLKCAQRGPLLGEGKEIPIRDITTLLAEQV